MNYIKNKNLIKRNNSVKNTQMPFISFLIIAITICSAILANAQTSGNLDTTFNQSGFNRSGFGFGGGYFNDVTVQSDGKIIAVGQAINGVNYDFSVVRYNSDGSFDTSFGEGGKVFTALGTLNDYANAAAIQTDGKIVVAGYSENGSNTDFAVVRYNSDGSLDATFNNTGKVLLTIGTNDDRARSVAIQSDGKIVVSGDTSNAGNRDFALVRYNSNGSLDSSFNTTGIVTTQIGLNEDSATDVAIQANGKIIAVGGSEDSFDNFDFALVRYNVNGSLDTSFNSTGKVLTSFGNSTDVAFAVTIQADEKIVAAGYADNGTETDFALARYNADGSLDISFNQTGKVSTAVGSNNDYAFDVAIQNDGKIVATGNASNGANRNFALVRYNSNGSLDTSFNETGKVLTAIGTSEALAHSLAIQSDGKIVTAGFGTTEINSSLLARHNSDGSLDNSFNGTGKLINKLGNFDSYVTSTTIQTDGKIVAAGYAFDGSNYGFAVARYNTNGSPDISFNGSGKVLTSIGTSAAYANAATIQTDGKIVVAGYASNGVNSDFALTRYNSDGSLDTSFNGTGKVLIAMSSSYDYAYTLAVQTDGKIIVAGMGSTETYANFALARLNSDGSLDTSFNKTGKISTPIGTANDGITDIKVRPDGKILAAGFAQFNSKYDFALAKYNSDGSLDTSFNGSGKVMTSIGTMDDFAKSLTVQSDDKIVIAGRTTRNDSETDFALARYNADGSLDASFDNDGKVVTAVGNGDNRATGVVIQTDGKIIASGTSFNGTDSDFALARYNSDGSPDTTFNSSGGNGTVLINFGGTVDFASAISLDSNGRYILAGQIGGLFGVARFLQSTPIITAEISGRVVNNFGKGLTQINVSLQNTQTGELINTKTNSFGNFRFDGLPTGNMYIIAVADGKRYTFKSNTQTVHLFENVNNLTFVGSER